MTTSLDEFQATMKSSFDGMRDDLREFTTAFHGARAEMIQDEMETEDIINIDSDSVSVFEESDMATEKIHEVHSGSKTELFSTKASLQQSDLSRHQISAQTETLELLVHIQVPTNNLEPNLQFHKELADVCDDYCAGELCDRAGEHIEVLHVYNMAENYTNSINSTPLPYAYQVFDRMLLEVSRVKHKSMQRKIPKSWKFKYKIMNQGRLRVVRLLVTHLEVEGVNQIVQSDSVDGEFYGQELDSFSDRSFVVLIIRLFLPKRRRQQHQTPDSSGNIDLLNTSENSNTKESVIMFVGSSQSDQSIQRLKAQNINTLKMRKMLLQSNLSIIIWEGQENMFISVFMDYDRTVTLSQQLSKSGLKKLLHVVWSEDIWIMQPFTTGFLWLIKEQQLMAWTSILATESTQDQEISEANYVTMATAFAHQKYRI